MFFKKKTTSMEVARQIIKDTGWDNNLRILKLKKEFGSAEPLEFLKFVVALSVCNLVQTMKADFIARKISAKNMDEITRDYIVSSLNEQDLIKLKKNNEVEGVRSAVMGIVSELQVFWKEEEAREGSGPGPRYYCVKEVLRRMGGEKNFELHDFLFELMCLHHKI